METTRFYLLLDGDEFGPYRRDQLLAAGMQHDTMVRLEGSAGWRPVHQIPDLARLMADTRAGLPPSSAERAPIPGARYPEAYLASPYHTTMTMLNCLYAAFAISFVGRLASAYHLQNQPIQGRIPREEPELIQLANLGSTAAGYLLVPAVVIGFLVFLYRAWAIIQDGKTTVTPRKSVGFLFIPLFQYWWVFISVAGLPYALNRYADRHFLIAPRASVLLGLAICVYFVLTPIPYFGTALGVLNLFLLPVFMRSIFRTTSCFCQGNERFASDDAPVEVPMVTRSAWVAGCIAILLPMAAIGLGFVGVLGVLASQNEMIEKSKALEAKVDEKAEKKGWRKIDKNGAEAQLKKQLHQGKEPKEIQEVGRQLIAYIVLGGMSFPTLILAIYFAIMARQSNAKLNGPFLNNRPRVREPARR